MDYQIVLNLMKEMNQTDLTKLEIEEEGFRISIEKNASVVSIASPIPAPQANIGAPVSATASVQSSVIITPDGATDQPKEAEGIQILSPMVGTFYAQPSPEKPPFVKPGDKIKKGQTVCIIEAMKLMNEIESEFDGEVVQVLVENEEMVQYGQPLFILK